MAELISAGPASFATKGERQAAALLKQELPSDWTVICNKVFPLNNDISFEIDFIIIAQRWIFLLDEKSWGGRIRGDDEQWIHANGSAERSPLAKVDYVAKVFAGRLSYQFTPLKQGGHCVRGGVVLSKQNTYPLIKDPRATSGVFLLSDVCQRLPKLDSRGGNPSIGQWGTKIKDELVHFTNRPQVPDQINFLKIEDAITLRPNVRLFYATAEDNKEERYHLLVYDLSKDPLRANELNEFYKQEYRAIKKLSATGLAPDVQNPFIWSEDYLVVTITPPTGKSLKAIALPETRDEFVQELQLAATCFKALNQIHSHGVIHRALGPETIYVQSKHPPKVMFTNFYAARVGAKTISLSLDALSIEDPYASIDVAVGYENASAQTDTFSLALILFEHLSGVSISKIRPRMEDKLSFPDQPRWSSFLTQELSVELQSLLCAIIQPPNGAAPLSAQEMANGLAHLAERLRTEINGDEGRLLCKRYRVQRVLGQSTMARTYKVTDTYYEELGSSILKQFLHPDKVNKQVVAEYKALDAIASVYLPRIEYIFAPEDDAHLLMQYIPGPTLQMVETEFPWPLKRWWLFAQHLLDAIDILEKNVLLHRNIHPAHIILHEDDNRPVLIGFDFTCQMGTDERIPPPTLYRPPEASSSAQTPPTTDRYASAVVLFQVLTGILPFSTVEGGQRSMIHLDQFEDTKVRRIAMVLQHAVSNNPAERPTTVAQLHNDLEVAFLAIEETTPAEERHDQINTCIEDIGSLNRNSDTGNAKPKTSIFRQILGHFADFFR